MHETRLYGPIGGFGINADEFLSGLPADAKEIRVRIHSPGGSVGEGLAIYHGLKDHSAKVITVVDGYAASSASFVMLAGDERHVHRNSLIFAHDPWTSATGNASELRKAADDLDVHAEAILDIYKTETGMNEADLRSLMEGETFFRGTDAVEMGFASTVIDDPEAENQIAAMMSLENIMSKQKTRKEIEDELNILSSNHAELESRLIVIGDEHTIAINEIEAQHTAVVDDLLAQVEAAKASIETLIAERDDATAKAVEAESALVESVVLVQAAEAIAEEKTAELDVAKARLADPAFVDAKAQAQDIEVQAIADAEADAAEKAAIDNQAKTEPTTPAEIYESMPAGAERSEYWKTNKRNIIKELGERE